MTQLICHLLGDYVFQNHWMATNKVRAWFPAMFHALVYTACFLILIPSPWALAVIFGTHLLIDRFRLAKYWVEFWGIGCPSWFQKINQPYGDFVRDCCGELSLEKEYETPPFLSVWLLIIVDNTFHLAINYCALEWL